MDRLNGLDLYNFAASLLASPEVGERASLLAEAVCLLVPQSACILYRRPSDGTNSSWIALATAGEVAMESAEVPGDSRLLASLIDAREPLVYQAGELDREDYAHLHVLRTLRSIGYVPLIAEDEVRGAFEIVAFQHALAHAELRSIESLAGLAAVAISSADDLHQQRQDLLDSIHRLTQLYDLEKSLNATLELDALIGLIPEKVAVMLPCQAIHLWMFDGGTLRLMSRFGYDDTVATGATESPGEGYVADMAEEGDPLLITDPEDPRLTSRNASLTGGDAQPITTALLVPLLQDGSEVGVIEAVNRADNQAFDDDDLFFLSTMSETVSSALKNASLLLAERKLEILETLVQVSSEITSTLRLDRLLQIIVNSPQSVLPFERCSVALDNRGKLQLKAISGMETIRAGDASVDRLRELVQWLSTHFEQLLVRQHGAVAEHEDATISSAIGRYFEESGYRSLFALPLTDDQGRVGLLLYESSDPDFLEIAQIEMIKVLAGQTTVAMRNALLYREVPLISLIEPFMHRKQAFLRSDPRRRWTTLAAAAAALAFLFFFPLPLRVSGNAVVAPLHVVTVAAPVEGNVEEVFAREGQRVLRGDVVGTLSDATWRTELTSAQTRYQAQMLTMQSDLARQSPLAGRESAQSEYLRAEMDRAQLRVQSAQLRSPIDGIVVTPNLGNAAGEHLLAGAAFAQVLDISNAMINVAVDQEDAPLLRSGQSVSIKLNSFPARTLHGRVSIVSPQAQTSEGKRVFFARVPLPNGNASLRDGMDGRAKIYVGFRPAGYVLLRHAALLVWQTLWNWIGW
ncbi:MAG TPA: GAF domain-containing protein [Acidisarcina sp.]